MASYKTKIENQIRNGEYEDIQTPTKLEYQKQNPAHQYPDQVLPHVEAYEEQTGKTAVKARKAEKEEKMARHEKVAKIMAKRAKTRRDYKNAIENSKLAEEKEALTTGEIVAADGTSYSLVPPTLEKVNDKGGMTR